MNWADKGMTLRKELSERRCFYSMRIHEALRRNGMSAAVVAYELGISRASVSATILGKNHSARVLDALRSAGVPEKYLFDPRRVIQLPRPCRPSRVLPCRGGKTCTTADTAPTYAGRFPGTAQVRGEF